MTTVALTSWWTCAAWTGTPDGPQGPVDALAARRHLEATGHSTISGQRVAQPEESEHG